MHKMIAGLTVGSMGLALLAGCAHDKEEKIAPEAVPATVMDSVKARLPGVVVTGVDRENEHGAVVYDFEMTQQGRKYEMDVKVDGTIMEIEKQVMMNDLPPAVSKAIQAKYPNTPIEEIMEVDKISGHQETPDHYELSFKSEGKETEINVSLDGSKFDKEDDD